MTTGRSRTTGSRPFERRAHSAWPIQPAFAGLYPGRRLGGMRQVHVDAEIFPRLGGTAERLVLPATTKQLAGQSRYANRPQHRRAWPNHFWVTRMRFVHEMAEIPPKERSAHTSLAEMSRDFRENAAILQPISHTDTTDGTPRLQRIPGTTARIRPENSGLMGWLVGRDGFEPSTSGLKVRCSTD